MMGRRMLLTPQPQLRGVCADYGCYNVAADDACVGHEMVVMGFALLGPAGRYIFLLLQVISQLWIVSGPYPHIIQFVFF